MTIVQKQAILFKLGHLPLSGVDGIWGDASKEATKAMQRAFGLEEDGIWGKQTDAAVNKALGMEQEQTGTFWEEIEYFTREEFRCQCGDYHAPYCDGYPAEPKEAIVRICDMTRRHFKVPVDIISGLRCSQHNSDSGGVANSQHMYGEAADIHVRGVVPSVVEAFLDTISGVRYHYTIAGSNNVHFDVPKGDR